LRLNTLGGIRVLADGVVLTGAAAQPRRLAVLALLSQVIAQARAAGKPVSVCGEMAGDPEFTQILLAMGLRSLSMHPSQIAAIKQRVLRTDAKRWAPHLQQVLGADDPQQACQDVARALSSSQRERAAIST